jgi:hypothetical protein
MSFLPTNYKLETSNSAYMKIVPGDNKIRLLTYPITGHREFMELPGGEKKVFRYKEGNKPDKPKSPNGKIQQFWAMVIWDYKEEKLKILEITQKSIQANLMALATDPDFGEPYSYDLKINRQGQDLLTKYIVSPLSKAPLSENIKTAFLATPILLDALYVGGDPFTLGDETNRTKAFFESSPKRQAGSGGVVTANQAKKLAEKLKDISNDDAVWASKFMNEYGIASFSELPVESYNEVLGKLASKLDLINDEVPF